MSGRWNWFLPLWPHFLPPWPSLLTWPWPPACPAFLSILPCVRLWPECSSPGFQAHSLPFCSLGTQGACYWEPCASSGPYMPACWRGSGFFLCSSSTFHWAVFSHLVRTLTEAHGLLSLPPRECEREEGVFCFFGSCYIFRSWHHSWHSEHFCAEKCPRWDYSTKM